MNMNIDIHDVTCVHVEDAVFNSDRRSNWRNITVTTLDGQRFTISLYAAKERDQGFPIVIGGENE